jgi:hypothetical protein
MIVSITVARYSKLKLVFGILSMAIFNIYYFVFRAKRPSFYKLMGTGKNGTFDIYPDFGQWAYLSIWDTEESKNKYEGKFVKWYISKFAKSSYTIRLNPTKSHGLWDGENPFIKDSKQTVTSNKNENQTMQLVGVLTRASIRLSKASQFWQNVPEVSKKMLEAKGYLYSIGIGEVPFLKQSTFSIWETEADMVNFAYKQREHAEVIKKTKRLDWYSEELFARFEIVKLSGDLPEKLKEISAIL